MPTPVLKSLPCRKLKMFLFSDPPLIQLLSPHRPLFYPLLGKCSDAVLIKLMKFRICRGKNVQFHFAVNVGPFVGGTKLKTNRVRKDADGE